MKLQDVYTKVAQRADTPKQKINSSEVSRVLSSFFHVLNTLSPADASDLIAKGLRANQKPERPRKPR